MTMSQMLDDESPRISGGELDESIDNTRLRQICSQILNINIGPITPNTKRIYLRKLHLVLKDQNGNSIWWLVCL